MSQLNTTERKDIHSHNEGGITDFNQTFKEWQKSPGIIDFYQSVKEWQNYPVGWEDNY